MYFQSEGGESLTVVLGGREVEIQRARLGRWLVLEQIRRQETSAKMIKEYLACACGAFEPKSGLECLRAFAALTTLNRIRVELPMHRKGAGSGSAKKASYDYDGRWAVGWVHSLASVYHWTREVILALDVDEAATYIQEISIDEQLDAEWRYSLSPNAYSYDANSHSNRFVPLRRPEWMVDHQYVAKKTVIQPEYLPQGPTIRMENFLH